MRQRVQWIDMTKGIGIILVIIGHFMGDNAFTRIIYIFHIPLFFIISGYLFSLEKDTKTIIVNKLKGLVLPYFTLGIPIIISQIKLGNEQSLYDTVVHYIIQEKYTTMWFLACLIIVNIFAYVIIQVSQKNVTTLIFSVLVCAIGHLYNYIFGKESNLPWNINTACVACLYFVIGYLIKKGNIISKVTTYGKKLGILSFIIGVGLGEISLHITGKRYDMFYNQYGVLIISVAAALLCSVGIISLVGNGENRIFSYLGRNSLIYFAFHQTIFKQIFKLIFPNWNLFEQLFSTIITIIGITIISELINKTFLKYFIGKR